MNSFLYDRLSNSKDKSKVLELANQGQVIRNPEDSLKEPVILDFLGYKQDDDNPTIGLLLCSEKNDVVVQYTLDEKNEQIFARKYQFHLPSVEQLKQELQKEIELMELKEHE